MRIIRDLQWPEQERQTILLQLIHESFERNGALGLSRNGWILLARLWHAKVGSQVWVSKEVSCDLELSDIEEPDFTNVPWLAPSLEFIFEDPTLPSCHLYQVNSAVLLGPYMKDLGVEVFRGSDVAEYGLSFDLGEEKSGRTAIASTCYGAAKFNAIANGGDGMPTEFMEGLSNDETEAMKRLMALTFKVLFFTSIDQFKPAVTNQIPTRAEGGKPGFRNRPKTNRFRVVYLPVHRAEWAKRRNTHCSERAFNGKRGHMRTYRHDRFTTMKGRRVFIPPVPGPDGTYPHRVFKVNKNKSQA